MRMLISLPERINHPGPRSPLRTSNPGIRGLTMFASTQPGGSRALHIAAVVPQLVGGHSPQVANSRQNAIHLLKLLSNANTEHRLEIRTTNNGKVNFHSGYLPGVSVLPSETWQEIPDLIFDFGGNLNSDQVADLRAQGAKVVNYCCGPDYLLAAEPASTRSLLPAYHDIAYDEVWVTPQVARATYFVMHTIGKNAIKVAPFIWDPIPLASQGGYGDDSTTYEPDTHALTVSIIPPAIDAARSCLFPLLIAENVQRRGSADLDQVLVRHGSVPVPQHETYANLIAKLDISQNGIVAFQGPETNRGLIGGRSEIHLSYQADFSFGDDILYLCWLGYPVVHNWDLGSDLGYYYRGNDLSEGSKRLGSAIERHSLDWSTYRARQRKCIARFLPSSPELIDIYSRMIQDLLD